KCGILDISFTDISLFENYCYKWNIEGDLWTKPFTAEDENRILLESIRLSVINPLIKLKKKVSGKNTALSVCRMLYEYLEECGAERSIGKIMGKLISLDRDYEASELKRLWSCLIDILDSVAGVLGEEVITFTEISRIIKSMIGKLDFSVPPQTLDSVTTASARTARLSEPKVVFVMGANDGDFPNKVNIHGLFSENDKNILSENGIEISRSISELVSAERLVVYKTLSSASEKIYITYTLSDLSGKSKYPAQSIESIVKMFGDKRNILLTKDDINSDYYAVTYHSAFYHYMQNIKENNEYISSMKKILMDNPEYKERIKYIKSRSEMQQDYKVETDVMRKLKSFEPFKLSATGVEDYNKCNFMYFCKHFMKLEKCEKIELNDLIAGNIIHACLAELLRNTDKDTFISMSAEELKKRIEIYALDYIDKKYSGDFGKNNSFYFRLKKLIENIVIILIHLQQELQVTDFIPVGFEVELTEKYPLCLTTEDGHKIIFGGKVDRIDTCTTIGDEKYLRIIDYKSTGKKITAESIANGINIQMLLYLFTAVEKSGMFSDYKPAGVLYSPVYPNEKNEKDIKNALKSTGLVLNNPQVQNAMEYGIADEFISVKARANEKAIKTTTPYGMEWLRKYLYDMLRKMVSSLLNGDVNALPQVIGSKLQCEYCEYSNICGDSVMIRPSEDDIIDEVNENLKKTRE
ncbi:MAG: PD-(D/E)XK nuclease family protein, partial [Ruminococcus sp.]|nr:PD-(D/E)XK nuclease family protein [Ruminococcus sp.]